ncbi:hypothetical protein ACFTAO_39260 [Paenibacillus rhizoplanae]
MGRIRKMGETRRRRTALRASASAGLQRKRPEGAGRAPPGLQGQTVQSGNPAAGRGSGSKVRSEAVKTRRGSAWPEPGAERGLRGEALQVRRPAGRGCSGLRDSEAVRESSGRSGPAGLA